MIHAFFIINKSGGLIYTYKKEEILKNHNLFFTTSFIFSISEMTKNLYKNQKSEIFINDFKLTIYNLITNYKFVFISDFVSLDRIKNYVLEMFFEFVMKNPGFSDEMRIGGMFKPEKYF